PDSRRGREGRRGEQDQDAPGGGGAPPEKGESRWHRIHTLSPRPQRGPFVRRARRGAAHRSASWPCWPRSRCRVGPRPPQLSPRVPGAPETDSSTLFQHLNTGKLSAAIDVRTTAGRDVLFELIHRWADVVVSSYPRKEADEMGIRFENLKARSPRIVVVSVT